jgi:hypothetical protein
MTHPLDMPQPLKEGELAKLCEICGQPMPKGEEMFKYHGHSGTCPEQLSMRNIVLEIINECREYADNTDSDHNLKVGIDFVRRKIEALHWKEATASQRAPQATGNHYKNPKNIGFTEKRETISRVNAEHSPPLDASWGEIIIPSLEFFAQKADDAFQGGAECDVGQAIRALTRALKRQPSDTEGEK